ncbi:MAG: transposase, partial [Anaerovoracaceae bacterium]
NKYCCVNDKDIYALECIPEHETKSKNLDLDYKKPEPKKQYIPSMNHPWRKSTFGKFVKKQEHHWNDDEKAFAS